METIKIKAELDMVSNKPQIDRKTGQAFFGLTEEVEQWLADHEIAWTFSIKQGTVVNDLGTPLLYLEIDDIIFIEGGDAALFKLRWM